MAYLSVVFLILSVFPALFPRWRDALIASGIFYAVSLALLFWVIRQVETMSSGEGPAFFAVIIYFGIIQIILGASLIAKLITMAIAKRIYVSTRPKLIKYFVGIFIIPVVLALVIYTKYFVGRNIVIIACILFSPFLWVSVAMLLLPNNSFKPTPKSGAAELKC